MSNPEMGARLFLSRAPSDTTWAAYSPSSASPRAASCAASCLWGSEIRLGPWPAFPV